MTPSFEVNRDILEMEYAVRGAIPQRAAELARQGVRTIPCNIGNPQALGQRPISYSRQVLSLVENPSAIGRERRLNALRRERAELGILLAEEPLHDHVLDIAEHIVGRLATGMGAYTESAGFGFIREAVARFIDRRDGVDETHGVPSNPNAVFLTNGASEAAKYILEMLIAGPRDGIMIPIPQYPLYSAAIRKNGGVQVNYYPDEDSGWSLDRSAIEEPLRRATADGVTVKAIVVINPGNPTGAILDEASMAEVIEVAREHRLAIIADEVYQENLYGNRWTSFARVLGDARDVPLFSLHSVSKGFYGECGHRGGYLEVRNPPAVDGSDRSFMEVLLKQASVSLCSNTVGQVLTYLMVRPPDEGSEPHRIFVAEKERVLSELYAKATMIRAAFAEMEGVECFGRIGAMYLFPRLALPAGTNDFDYCMALLEETGLCTVNGSGFGQKPGTHHLRIAFLPPRELLEEVLPRWIAFHNRYVGA